MNIEQLTTLILKLDEISKDLADAINEESVAKKDLMVYQTRNELIDVVNVLMNHRNEIEL